MNIKHTIFTGKRFIYLESTPSTNEYAHELITKTNPIDGTVIFADEQTKGKGQSGNSWHSEKGKSLTFSILFKTGFLKAVEQAYINFAVSLGILKALKEISGMEEDLYIKWPNDLYYKNQKLGGILIENTIKGQNLEYSVVGIGINVGKMHFPEGIKAISLEDFSTQAVRVENVCEAICEGVEHYFLKLRKGRHEFNVLKEEYESQLLGKGKERSYELKDGSHFVAVIEGVDLYGRLLLNIKGETKAFDNKEVVFLI